MKRSISAVWNLWRSMPVLFVPVGLIAQTNLWQESGSIGIGTTVPDSILTVNGPIHISTADSLGQSLYLGIGKTTHFIGIEAGTTNHDKWEYNEGLKFVRYGSGARLDTMFLSSAGDIGIGTLSPGARLDVRGHAFLGSNTSGGAGDRRIKFTDDWTGFPDGTFGAEISNDTDDYKTLMIVGNRSAGGPRRVSVWDRFEVNGNATVTGNVGVGTVAPFARLAVVGDSAAPNDGGIFQITTGGGANTDNKLVFGVVDAGFSWIQAVKPGDNFKTLALNPAGGNVGIGTTSPSHKLTVNGTIRAKEVIVDTGWADYVFAEDYRLAPLSEVEAHIKEHKHLPDMPSAAEVAEQGVSMGQMQTRMMAKIEELTLHLIEQQKQIEALKAEVARNSQKADL